MDCVSPTYVNSEIEGERSRSVATGAEFAVSVAVSVSIAVSVVGSPESLSFSLQAKEHKNQVDVKN